MPTDTHAPPEQPTTLDNSSHREAQSVFDAHHWALTLGILLGVTLFAFESLAVVTIAPRIATALQGRTLYGWIFSGFLLSSLLGTVVGGAQADRHGPGRPFLGGLLLFATGLLLSGFAPGMGFLIGGRVVQGLGGGAVITALYAAVNVAYPDTLRPRIVALMSSAWVVPALVGPALAGLLAQALSWRAVFWGMVPLLGVVALLATPAFRRLGAPAAPAPKKDRLRPAFGLVLGTGLLLAGLSLKSVPLALLAALVGAAVAFSSLRQLLPAGTLRLRRGLPAVVAARGLFYAGFIGVEAFLALVLTSVHGFSPATTGLAIASGAISWTLGSWTQDRLDTRFGSESRPTRILTGTLIVSLGLGVQIFALLTTFYPLFITVGGWMLAGLGIGLAHSSSSVLAFALAPSGEEGAVSASLQLADQFSAALSTGVGGALFALSLGLGMAEVYGIFLALIFSVMLALLSVVAARRIARQKAQ